MLSRKVYIVDNIVYTMKDNKITASNNTSDNNNIINEKKINRFEFKIIKINDLSKFEFLNIELTINESLQQLLKEKFIITSLPLKEYNLNGIISKRYLIKEDWINKTLYGSYKLIFSDYNLIKNKRMVLQFNSAMDYEQFLRDLKSNFKALIETIRDYAQLNLTLTIEDSI
jgi:hypothetical protein